MKDSLGDRMKRYENITRQYLTPRTNILLRLDGRAFHTYTRHCNKPFDDGLMADMDKTAIALCEEIQGCKLAYVQSDEITLWLTSYDDITTMPWFDGNIQKICSIGASIATAEFNRERIKRLESDNFDIPFAHFDARVWTVPELHEVANTFLWRSQDAARNSVQMMARSLYSHAELEGKNNSQLQEMIFQKGQNWNDLPSRYKCGRIILKEKKTIDWDSSDGSKITMHLKATNWSVQSMSAYNFEYWAGLIKSLAP